MSIPIRKDGLPYVKGEPFDEVRLEKIRFAVGVGVAIDLPGVGHAVTADAFDDYLADILRVNMKSFVLGVPERELERLYVDVPLTWWQMLKQQYFPLWLLERFPVQYRTVEKYVKKFKTVCPHVATADYSDHIRYLAKGE